MNLVNMAMSYIGPAVAQHIATKMGIGGPVVNKLIAAALPTIMGSLIGKSKTGGGLDAILSMVTGDNRPQSNQLAEMFDGGGDIDALANSGSGMLEGLLGGQSLGALSGALGRHAGVDEAQAGSLLGMLAPAAMGSLGDQIADQGLDSAGAAKLLSDQAGHVASAMPAGFASELEGLGLSDSLGLSSVLGGGMSSVTEAAASATEAVGDAASSAKDAIGGAANSAMDMASSGAAEAKKSMGVMPWIIGAVVIALLAWFFLGRGGPEVDTASVAGGQFEVGGVDIGGQFGTITGTLTDTFTGITDQASAEAALPQLEDISGQLGTLGETAGQLSGAAQTGFQGVVATALETLRPVIDNAIASSGAGAILQPVVDQIIGALEGMAG